MYSYGHISEADQAEIWRLRDLGESISEIARRIGTHRPNIHWFLAAAGGRRPLHVVRSDGRLSVSQREEIAEGLACGLSCREHLDFTASTGMPVYFCNLSFGNAAVHHRGEAFPLATSSQGSRAVGR